MTKRFLSIGECMVELAPQEGGLYAAGYAGDTFNTAWYMRRLLPSAWRVFYLTVVGTDDVSDRMVAFMERAGIATDHILRHDSRTVGLYMISLKGAERSFSYWRSVSAARLLADDTDHLERATAEVNLAYLSGITLAILDPDGRERLLVALKAARSRGTQVAFDPNLRPRLWASEHEMCETIMRFAASADIVLPSHEDEARHFGDANAEETLARYRKASGGLVVVKDGAQPILAAGKAGRWDYLPPPVTHIVDTTAAGDSFNAGFLANHLSGAGMDASLAAGASVAARVIGARGALVA